MVEGELMNAEKTVPVDLKMSIMKPVGAGWLFGLFNYLKEIPPSYKMDLKLQELLIASNQIHSLSNLTTFTLVCRVSCIKSLSVNLVE